MPVDNAVQSIILGLPELGIEHAVGNSVVDISMPVLIHEDGTLLELLVDITLVAFQFASIISVVNEFNNLVFEPRDGHRGRIDVEGELVVSLDVHEGRIGLQEGVVDRVLLEVSPE